MQNAAYWKSASVVWKPRASDTTDAHLDNESTSLDNYIKNIYSSFEVAFA